MKYLRKLMTIEESLSDQKVAKLKAHFILSQAARPCKLQVLRHPHQRSRLLPPPLSKYVVAARVAVEEGGLLYQDIGQLVVELVAARAARGGEKGQ